MRDLTVTLVQAPLHWEDVDANLDSFQGLLNGIGDGTDLIVLPEMFTTGFTMNAAPLAQKMSGSAVEWAVYLAKKNGCVLMGSMIIEDQNRYYNRLLWAQPDGRVLYYDKRHLFRMSGEHTVYSAGDHHLTINLHGWNIRPFICYDLRFPAWLRNVNNAYDVAVIVANWPRPRSQHWKLLLQARAVENQSYVVGVNRVGTDGNGHSYSGDSAVIAPEGNVRFEVSDKTCTRSIRLTYKDLANYRESFPAWRDADDIGTIFQ